MPDANGKFKGIAVPELPWKKQGLAQAQHAAGRQGSGLTCVNPNCKFCAQAQPQRPRS